MSPDGHELYIKDAAALLPAGVPLTGWQAAGLARRRPSAPPRPALKAAPWDVACMPLSARMRGGVREAADAGWRRLTQADAG